MDSAQTFLKLDSASSVHFLTSFASSLAQEDLISERIVDEFKRTITILTPKLNNTDQSFLSLLWDYDPTFINILMTRYGATGFAWNHFRISTRSALAECNAALVHFANHVLKKSDLFMNRSFVAKSSLGHSKRELFPNVLLHLSKCIHHAVKNLTHVIHSFSSMRPAEILDVSGDQYEIERRIALHIGFTDIESDILAYCRTEQRAIQIISSTFEELSISLRSLLSGLSENIPQTSSSKLLDTTCENFISQCQRLAGLKLDISSNLSVWETRRIAYLKEMNQLKLEISTVTQAFSENLTPKDHLRHEDLISTDVESAIVCFLLNQGHKLNLAQAASRDLIQYCNVHKVKFEMVLPAELKKINQTLNPEALTFASTLTSENPIFTPGGSSGKHRFLIYANELKKSLSSLVPFAGVLAVPLIIALVSCGIKTSVASELKDPRPDIPFRNIENPPILLEKGAGSSLNSSKIFKEIRE